MAREVADVLESAKRVLENALQGEADYLEGADRAVSGLYNAVSAGRSVTIVLQNLTSSVADFGEWYEPHVERLKADPIAKYFVKMRNDIEKRGTHGEGSTSITLNRASTADLMRDPPPGAKSRIIGGPMGLSYWTVELPDGSETIVYSQVDESVASIKYILDGAPDNRALDDLLRHWLSGLEEIYLDAVRTYSNDASLKLIRRPHRGPFDEPTMAALRAAITTAGYRP